MELNIEVSEAVRKISEESDLIFKEIDKMSKDYFYEQCSKRVITLSPFKVGDIIRHRTTGAYHVVEKVVMLNKAHGRAGIVYNTRQLTSKMEERKHVKKVVFMLSKDLQPVPAKST